MTVKDKVRILLVEDHLLVRQGVKALLERKENFEIIAEAGDGANAVESAKELKPDIILLDIELPDFDGNEVAKRIIADNPEQKILALSRHSERGFVSRMFSNKAMGYILKDSALEELIKAIETVMSGQKYLSPSLIEVVLDESAESLPSYKHADLDKLTPREVEILKYIAEGNSTKEIAFMLELSSKTVDAHRYQIMNKLDIHNVADLTRLAIKEGLVDL